MIAVVDTNVAVVANQASPQASPECVASCVRALTRIMNGGKLVLDDGWHILREYLRYRTSRGQPGFGDEFFEWVITHRTNASKCELVTVHKTEGAEHGFREFPDDPLLADFDKSDRKFIAVACAHEARPPIIQAVDSKWYPFKAALDSHGVTVQFICMKEIRKKLSDSEDPG